MMQEPNYREITPGTLWQRLCATYEMALATGALQRFATDSLVIEAQGIPFIIRMAVNLQRKHEEKQKSAGKGPDFNPFLPPEAALTVGALGAEHLAVLNKYNVVDHHLLIITRHFAEQEQLLTLSDLGALCRALQEIDGLGFYNGGTTAGASQRHKHLQLIPIEGLAVQAQLPIDAAIPADLDGTITRLDALPFSHRIAALPEGLFADAQHAAAHCHPLYLAMLARLGCAGGEAGEVQHCPYNLLLTRRWLMVVPRRCEHAGPISINAMGFAGSLFVRDAGELALLRKMGPVAMLQAVSAAAMGG